jgi:CRP/FNR family transcriptional regulator
MPIDLLASRPRSFAVPAHARPRVVAFRDAGAHCASCGVRGLCIAHDLDAETVRELDALFGTHARVAKREVLYRAGSPFSALYAIRVGTFKTLTLAEDGREQITGYHMTGDVLGFDGLSEERHSCEAVALEDSEVCALPFEKLDELARAKPALRRNLFRLLSSDVSRGQDMMLLLGSMRSEERLASFLLNLARRFQRRGYSASEFALRMTREEIASYLGLTLETVSRLFSRLQSEGLIQVQGRAIKVLDVAALKRMVGLSG